MKEVNLDGIIHKSFTLYASNQCEELKFINSGKYQILMYGADGSTSNYNGERGGPGGQSVGELILNAGDTLYAVVGTQAGYNGGGSGQAPGGGATHIAYVPGLLPNLYNQRDKIIMVAGGGGGLNETTAEQAAA